MANLPKCSFKAMNIPHIKMVTINTLFNYVEIDWIKLVNLVKTKKAIWEIELTRKLILVFNLVSYCNESIYGGLKCVTFNLN